jgi:hypothetical protein
MSCSPYGRTRTGNVTVAPSAVERYGECSTAKRAIGVGGDLVLGQAGDDHDHHQNRPTDVVIPCGVRPDQLTMPVPNPEKATGGSGSAGPPFLPEWVGVGRVRACALTTTP